MPDDNWSDPELENQDPFAVLALMMDQLSGTEQLRAMALLCACRAVRPGDPVGHFLSSARQFHHYLLTGLTRTGSERWGVEFGARGVAVRVDGKFDDDILARLETAITEVLS
jgi:hypothetical protein